MSRWKEYTGPHGCHPEDVEYVVEEQPGEKFELDGGWLVVDDAEGDGFQLEFALFRFSGGPSYGPGGPGPERHTMLMHGSGPSGSLRECRHTYWGEGDNGGYIFYPPFKLIAQALVVLEKWYDGS